MNPKPNLKLKHFLIIFLILLISSIISCQGAVEIEKLNKSIKIITEYEKVKSITDISLTDSVFVSNNASTMDVKFIDGNLKLSDAEVHNKRDIVLLESTLVKELKGYNGHSVQVFHINDEGVYDYIEIHELVKADGYVYLFDIEFSEVIIDGYVGTWEVTAYNLSVSDSLSFGQTFNASNVTSLPVNVTDDATKSHPYDINTTGLVGWWKLDDDYNDSSGNNNHATGHGTDIHFDYGKHNNDTVFNGVDDCIYCGNDESLNITNAITISAWVNSAVVGTSQNSYAGIVATQGFKLDVNEGGNGVFFFRIYDVSGQTPMAVGTTVPQADIQYHVVAQYTGSKIRIYVNGILEDEEDRTGVIYQFEQLEIGRERGDVTRYFNGSIDSVRIYNRVLSATEIKHNYYDHLQQLQIKTNSNSTWSDEWNSTADNPIQVPYADGELISLLNFTVPDSVVQNGITIYDYPSTVQFDAVATVGYTEDITKITEEATASTYTLNVTHAANNTGEGYINYTTANAVLLDADFWNAATLTTDNPNASLSTTLPNFNISTGYIAAATEYYYLIEQDYFYPPTGLTATAVWTNNASLDWTDSPNADKYSIYQDGAFLINTTASEHIATSLNSGTDYNFSVTLWNGTQQSDRSPVIDIITNYDNFTFTNAQVSPSAIYEGNPFTVSVDINDTDGAIATAIVKIDGTNYTMTNSTGDTWTYTFTGTAIPTRYFVQNFYAQDNTSAWNSTTSTLSVMALPSTGTGGFGGAPADAPEPIPEEEEPTEEELIPEEPTDIDSILTTLEETLSKATNTTEITSAVKNIFKSKEVALVGVKYTIGDYSTTKDIVKPEALTCESTDPRVSCGVMDGIVTIIVMPTTDDSKLYQFTDTYVKITNNDLNVYHFPVSLSLVNLMWYFNFNMDIGIKNPYIVAEGINTDTTVGLRGWWITVILGLAIVGFMRKYN